MKRCTVCLNKFLVHSFMLQRVSFRDKLSNSLNSHAEYLALTRLIMSRCGPSYLKRKILSGLFQSAEALLKCQNFRLCPAIKRLFGQKKLKSEFFHIFLVGLDNPSLKQ